MRVLGLKLTIYSILQKVLLGSGAGICLFLSAALAAKPLAPVTILTMDFNQDGETKVLEKYLGQCPNVRIHRLNTIENKTNSAYAKILELCKTENFEPDWVSISGHYAGTWTGELGRLSLSELEKLSCEPQCRRFFESVKVSSFLACNNLLGVPKDDEAPQDYVQRLREEHAYDFTIDEIIEAGITMYQPSFASTNAYRIGQVFSQNNVLLGFAGGAPLSQIDNGRSEKGFEQFLLGLTQSTNSHDICFAVSQLVHQPRERELQNLIGSWKRSMNSVDSGQDAVGIYADHFKTGRPQNHETTPPQELTCQLRSVHGDESLAAISRVAENPNWLRRTFIDVSASLDRLCGDPIFQSRVERVLYEPEKRQQLLTYAQENLSKAETLVHKWEGYRVSQCLDYDPQLESSVELDFNKYLRQFLKNPRTVNRDLFRETLIRAPSEMITSQQKVIHRIYKTTSDYHVRSDVISVLATDVGAIHNEVFHVGAITHANFSSDGKSILTGATDHKARLYSIDPSSSPPALLLTAEVRHSGSITGLDAQGSNVLTTSQDGQARIYSLKNGRFQNLGQFSYVNDKQVLRREITAAQLSEDGDLALTAFQNGILALHRIFEGRVLEIGTLRDPSGFISAAIARAGNAFVSANYDGLVRYGLITTTSTTKGLHTVFEFTLPGGAKQVQITSDGSFFTSLSYENEVFVHAFQDGQAVQVARLTNISSVSVVHRQIFIASHSGILKVYSPRNGKIQELASAQTDTPWISVSGSPSGRFAIAVSDQGSATLFGIKSQTLKPIGTLRAPAKFDWAKISPDETQVLTSSKEGVATLVGVEDFVTKPGVAIPGTQTSPTDASEKNASHPSL